MIQLILNLLFQPNATYQLGVNPKRINGQLIQVISTKVNIIQPYSPESIKTQIMTETPFDLYKKNNIIWVKQLLSPRIIRKN